MKVLPEDSPEIRTLADRVFDSYATVRMSGPETQEPTYRAVAAAAIVALTTEDSTWFSILDEAMQQRGVESHFGNLDYATRRYLHSASNYHAGIIGKKCRSITELLGRLADPAEALANA